MKAQVRGTERLGTGGGAGCGHATSHWGRPAASPVGHQWSTRAPTAATALSTGLSPRCERSTRCVTGRRRTAPCGTAVTAARRRPVPTDSGVLAATGLRLDAVGQLGALVVDAAPLLHQLPDLLVGVHDRRVVPTAE